MENYPNLPAQYEEEKRDITNFLSLVVMITAFLALLVIYDVSYTYGMAPYLTYIILAIVFGILFYYLYWANNLPLSGFWQNLAILLLILFEIYFVLFFWPTNPMTKGTIMTIVFYIFIGIFGLKLKNELLPTRILEYLSIGSIAIMIILLSMKWYTPI